MTEESTTKRLELYKRLAQHYSIIPLHPRSKIPKEAQWTRWCYKKREFKESDFVIHDAKGVQIRNAGVACGPASGVLVLDVDNVTKFEEWLNEKGYSCLPDTYTVKSGSGRSFHYYYQYPNDGQVYGNSSVKGIFDIRGVGGQVVAPGSLHPDTNSLYTVMKNIHLAPAPHWLLDMSRKEKADIQKPKSEVVKHASVDLDALKIPKTVKDLITNSTPKGTRSETEMSVINKLVAEGIDDDTIVSIFESYPIGEKHRERGNTRHEVMRKQINKAKKFLSDNKHIKKAQYSVISAGEIIDSDEKVEWLIEGIWPKKTCLILLGPGGAGKSMFSMDLAIELASPSKSGFLGQYRVSSPQRVLFVQSENTRGGLKERFDSMSQGLPDISKIKSNILFASNNNNPMVNGNLADSKFRTMLTKLVTENQINVLIFDPLSSFHTEDENSNSHMRFVLDYLNSFTQEYDVSIMVIHHTGKTSAKVAAGGRGATSIGDWAANSISLKPINCSDNLFQLSHVKARYGEKIPPVNIQRQLNLRHIALKGNKLEKEKLEKFVLQAITNLGDHARSQKAIIEEVQRLISQDGGTDIASSYNTVRDRINKLMQTSLIKQDPETKIFHIKH